MSARQNPFVHAGANDLPPDILLSYYIEDGSYSRFLQSRRNVFLVGERGCGKSMALLYNSWLIQSLRATQQGLSFDYGLVGIYVPCNTPLLQKVETELLGAVQERAVSEHFLVLSVTREIAATLATTPSLKDAQRNAELLSVMAYVLGQDFPSGIGFCDAITAFVDRSVRETQQSLNTPSAFDAEYRDTFSFASLILPLLRCVKRLPELRDSHFMLLIDDAHYLNHWQSQALNSWIAYRDHSLFSVKVAVANVAKYPMFTSSGGAILEGHDYMQLDMVRQLHNERTDFGQLAWQLIKRRLDRFGVAASPETFFPMSPTLEKDLAAAEAIVRQEAITKFGPNGGRKIADYVYKYARAHYFRSRSPRANRPEYSGFHTLVFLSTGVVRNLLIPCYWMYEKLLAQSASLNCIPPSVQTEAILERSQGLWDRLRGGLDKIVPNCSREDATHAYQLLDQLAVLFRERLLHHESEPRANSFTVSGLRQCIPERCAELERLFNILMEAQYLYVRSGPAKDKGKREWYYVPNRLLWPERGLDPHGQHARVSLKAEELWAAAISNASLPLVDDGSEQPVLFESIEEETE